MPVKIKPSITIKKNSSPLPQKEKVVESKSEIVKKENVVSDDFQNSGIRPTGIGALDELLNGGFPSDSTVLLSGGSGTGKTTLAMQWLVAGYKDYGEPGLYISSTEPLSKAIKNLEKYDFAEGFEMTNDKIIFEDMRTIISNLKLEDVELSSKNFDKIIDELMNLIQNSGAKRVVLDSITALAYSLKDKSLIRKFMYHLDSLIAVGGINVILISEVAEEGKFSVFGVEEFMSDGIISLTRKRKNEELIRYLEVVKMRGINYDSHPAPYKISKSGYEIYLNESHGADYKSSVKKISSGIKGLDEMMGGGYFEGSSILVSGPSGAGKSIFGMQFLVNNLNKGVKGILVSFEESKDQIFRNAKSFGWDLKDYEKKGVLKVLSFYPEDKYLEEHLTTIRKEVSKFGAQILVVDSLSALGSVFKKEGLRNFLSSLNAFIKSRLVTVIYTYATQTLMGSSQITDSHLSTVADQIVMLRYVEVDSVLRHALLVLKMRGGKHDKSMKEILFTKDGLKISKGFSGLEGVLSGSTRKVSESTGEKVHSLFLEYLGPMGETLFMEQKEIGLNIDSIEKELGEIKDLGILTSEISEEFLKKVKSIFK